MFQISDLEKEVDQLRSQLTLLKSKCDEFDHDRQGYEKEISELRGATVVEEERATTTLVLETQARPDEKHVSMSKLKRYYDIMGYRDQFLSDEFTDELHWLPSGTDF